MMGNRNSAMVDVVSDCAPFETHILIWFTTRQRSQNPRYLLAHRVNVVRGKEIDISRAFIVQNIPKRFTSIDLLECRFRQLCKFAVGLRKSFLLYQKRKGFT